MNFYKFSNKFYEHILSVAKYQKVVLVYDKTSNASRINMIKEKLEKDTIFLTIHIDNPALQSVVLDGTRCVVECLSVQNLCKLANFLDDNIHLVSIAENDCITKCIRQTNHTIFVVNGKKSVTDLLFVANILTENVVRCMANLQSSHIEMFQRAINIFVQSQYSKFDFVRFMAKLPEELKIDYDIWEELKNSRSTSIYLYLRILAIYFLFQSFELKCIQQLDVYKACQNDVEQINVCYKILTNERMVFVFRNQCQILKKIIGDIIGKIKLKNKINIIKINNEIKIIKNNAKNINNDNMLKYCYLYNIFNKI